MAISAVSQAGNYQVSLPKAAAFGAGGLAVGAGLPLVLSKITHGRVPAFEPRVLGMGVALAASAAVLSITQPTSDVAAATIGGITGAVSGAAGGALAMRGLGAGSRAVPLGLVLGGMWGGVMGLASRFAVKQ